MRKKESKEEWRCYECERLLAIISDGCYSEVVTKTQQTLIIDYRSIEVVCKCGAINIRMKYTKTI